MPRSHREQVGSSPLQRERATRMFRARCSHRVVFMGIATRMALREARTVKLIDSTNPRYGSRETHQASAEFAGASGGGGKT
jgi:hypothetical protein